MSRGVLVLDNVWRPVDHISIQEAVVKLVCNEAYPHERAKVIAVYRSPSTVVEVPSIICLKVYVPIPKRLSRYITNTLLHARDNYTCQYCGRHKSELDKGEKLSRDHVIPVDKFPGENRAARRKAATTWDNITTACTTCNGIKANRTPAESKMYPKTTPHKPSGVLITVIDRLDEEQLGFVKEYGFA